MLLLQGSLGRRCSVRLDEREGPLPQHVIRRSGAVDRNGGTRRIAAPLLWLRMGEGVAIRVMLRQA